MSTDPAAIRRQVRWSWRIRYVVALVLTLALSLLVVGADQPGSQSTSAPAADTAVHAASQDTAVAEPGVPDALPAPDPAPAPVPVAQVDSATAPVQDLGALVVPEPGTPSSSGPPTTYAAASAPGTDSAQTFARNYPDHAAARQRGDMPSTFHWAVIVGVNDYMGRTSSTFGSVGDALALRETLVREGWRGDQILTLTDHAATHDEIVRAIEWLIRSTDERSTVVFSFSGHMRHESGATALWPADNRFIWGSDLGRMLGAVRTDRMWVSLQGCHAAGLAAPGLEGPNRVVTYASRIEDKAYEDPAVGRSVMGHYLFAEGLRDGQGDRQAGNADGRVTAQEAFAWAAPRATSRTSGQQPYGAQRPVIVDGLGGREFPIAVTGAPAGPASAARPSGDGAGRTPSGPRSLLPELPLPEFPRVRVGLP